MLTLTFKKILIFKLIMVFVDNVGSLNFYIQ